MSAFKSTVGAFFALSFMAASGQSAAKFLSADPVKTNPNTGTNFNRYNYANNNPYRFTDPDGRYWCNSGPTQCGKIDGYVAGARTALANLPKNSDAAKKLSGALATLGTAWHKNGITLQPANLDKNTLAQANPGGLIEIDLKQIGAARPDLAAANPGKTNGQLEVAVGGGAIAHEARHESDAARPGIGFPTTKAAVYNSEMNAYPVTAAVASGLGVNLGLNTPADIAAAAQSSVNAWEKAQQP